MDDRLSALCLARPDCLYFAITLTANEHGQLIFATQTEWAGWSNEGRREELRRARLVYPKFAELWTHFRQPYAIVHTADEISLFLLGGGNALVEEQLGKSIFSNPLGIERSIRDGETGFLCRPGDPGAIATALLKILTDRGLAERLGASAHNRAMEKFNQDRVVDQLIGLYRSITRDRET